MLNPAIGLRPIREALHAIVPARDVGIFGEVAADDFAERDDAGGKVIRDGNRIAAEIPLVGPEEVLVEYAQIALCPALCDTQSEGLRRRLGQLVGLHQLAIAESVTEGAIKPGINPIHDLVDAGARLW